MRCSFGRWRRGTNRLSTERGPVALPVNFEFTGGRSSSALTWPRPIFSRRSLWTDSRSIVWMRLSVRAGASSSADRHIVLTTQTKCCGSRRSTSRHGQEVPRHALVKITPVTVTGRVIVHESVPDEDSGDAPRARKRMPRCDPGSPSPFALLNGGDGDDQPRVVGRRRADSVGKRRYDTKRGVCGRISSTVAARYPLNEEELEAIDSYWRAANYCSVGQIYLMDNPLLAEASRPEHVKPRLLGHFGTTPGLNLVYAHLNRVIKAVI